MQQKSTAFLIITLVIIVNEGYGAVVNTTADLVADEFRNKAVTIVDEPQYVTTQSSLSQNHTTYGPEQLRPARKPPINPNVTWKPKYVELTRIYFNGQPIQKAASLNLYSNQHYQLTTGSIYKYPNVITLPTHLRTPYYSQTNSNRLVFSASTAKPVTVSNQKINLPVQTVNSIRSDDVKPTKIQLNSTNNNKITTTEPPMTTTQRALRVKRIWPKRILEKINATLQNITATNNTLQTNTTDLKSDETTYGLKFNLIKTIEATTESLSTPRVYRRVSRKLRTTTAKATNMTEIGKNGWIPIEPTRYPRSRNRYVKHKISKRSSRSDIFVSDPTILTPSESKRTLYLHSYGLNPVANADNTNKIQHKKQNLKNKRKVKPYSGYITNTAQPFNDVQDFPIDDLQTEASNQYHHVSTKIKHHHHHHHHRYIKTIEKKVPFKVEVPKPFAVEKKVHIPVEKIKIVEKPVPYPVKIEKNVPYPIGIRVPHPVPVKVVEKEYVPKPFAVVQQVPILKTVEVKVPQPVTVEKKVPYPVQVKVAVPVDRPVPVPVPVEKKVPYPVPVKVFVPRPYPVETKVPYPVEVKVKEPYEVIKHIPIRVPVPQPYAVKVPHPVPVHIERQIPYPVEVEKKVPVEVFIPKRVEVEKRVPVYIPKPYPVEKKVPVHIKVPYPVRVPVRVPMRVPVKVPVFINVNPNQPVAYSYQTSVTGSASDVEIVSASPDNAGYATINSRSENVVTEVNPTTIASSATQL